MRASPSDRAPKRDLTSGALAPIAMEYDEMPGLRLTAAQAQRLFGLREDICVRVFDALVYAAILRGDVNGRLRVTVFGRGGVTLGTIR